MTSLQQRLAELIARQRERSVTLCRKADNEPWVNGYHAKALADRAECYARIADELEDLLASEAQSFQAEREHLHDIIARASGCVDPEQYPELSEAIAAVLLPCDEAGTGKCVGGLLPAPKRVALHLSCLPANLRELKRGLECGMFGPPVPLGRGPEQQPWANAVMAIGTVENAIDAIEYLQQLVALPAQAPRGPERALLQELRAEHRQCLVNAGVDNRCLRCYKIDGFLADAEQKGPQ